MWTQDNTNGFTDSELEMINRVLRRVVAVGSNVDVGNINDAINNSWVAGISESDLLAKTYRRIGFTATV